MILQNKETILCLFGEIQNEEQNEKRIIGYRMMYPFTLSLGTPKDDGTIPIQYTRWCPYTPVQEFKMSGDHIISVTYPDDNILDNYVAELAQYGITSEQIFFTEEEVNGDQREPDQAAE